MTSGGEGVRIELITETMLRSINNCCVEEVISYYKPVLVGRARTPYLESTYAHPCGEACPSPLPCVDTIIGTQWMCRLRFNRAETTLGYGRLWDETRSS